MSWATVQLGNYISLTGGYAFKSGDFQEKGIPLIRIGSANSGIFKTDGMPFLPLEYKSVYSKYLVKPNDLLITLTGTVGKGDYGNICVASSEYADYLLNQRVARINIESEAIDGEYVQRFLSTSAVKSKITGLSRGVRQANLKNEDILNLEIPLPYPDDPEKSLKEQKRIAAILDKADGIRRKRQQAIQLADDFLRSVFLDMFGDPGTNPKGWEVKPLKKEIIHANNGLSRRRKASDNIGDVVLRLQDVHYDGIRLSKVLNRIELDEKEKARYKVDIGDILFIRVNGNPEYVGRSAVFMGHTETVYHNDHIIRIKLSEKFNSEFLMYCFNQNGGRKLISKYIKTSAGQHTISQGGIEKLEFYQPPRLLQDKFVEIKRKKLKIPYSLEEANEIFNSLSQKAFKGEL